MVLTALTLWLADRSQTRHGFVGRRCLGNRRGSDTFCLGDSGRRANTALGASPAVARLRGTPGRGCFDHWSMVGMDHGRTAKVRRALLYRRCHAAGSSAPATGERRQGP
jgi:hypothetical protein